MPGEQCLVAVEDHKTVVGGRAADDNSKGTAPYDTQMVRGGSECRDRRILSVGRVGLGSAILLNTKRQHRIRLFALLISGA